jgi:hypothetical protein
LSSELVSISDNHCVVPTPYLDKLLRVYYLYEAGLLIPVDERSGRDGDDDVFEDLEDSVRVVFGEPE